SQIINQVAATGSAMPNVGLPPQVGAGGAFNPLLNGAVPTYGSNYPSNYGTNTGLSVGQTSTAGYVSQLASSNTAALSAMNKLYLQSIAIYSSQATETSGDNGDAG